ncbi:chemotaxis protein CheW [Litoribacillus peritrichatus]|uniref:Chemotaxis protein CheW n=1 Tax=Litoribacillus peritrichatus TaxID=718191 RepID=A0ABP7M454_9GAMM
MSDDQKSSKTKVKSAPVKPMAALQGYLDDMLSVATAFEEAPTALKPEPVTEPVVETKVEVKTEPEPNIEVTTEHKAELKTEVKPKVTTKQATSTAIDVPVSKPVQTNVSAQPKPPEPKKVSALKIASQEQVVAEPLVVSVAEVPDPVSPPPVVTKPEIAKSETVRSEPEPAKPVTVKPVESRSVEEKTAEAKSVTQTVSHTASQTPAAFDPVEKRKPYPDWAAAGFECLLFYVGGIKLAVPLVLLGGIHRIDTDLTPLFGQPDWFLGLYPRTTMDGQQNIRVVHTSRWVMPEKVTEDIDPVNHYVISLDDSEWGLLSHQLSDSIRLMPDQVKWRTSTGKRPWLAGTVIDHMCAILDVTNLIDMLQKNSKRIK